MTLEYAIRLLAGTLILFSLSLGYFIHNGWFLLTAFVGLNLIQSVFTKWCLAESLMKRYLFQQTAATVQEGKNA